GVENTRRFHEGGFTAAKRLSDQILFGTTTRFFDFNSNVIGEKDVRGYTFDAGLIFQATPGVRVAGVGYNLIGTELAQYPRGIGTGLALRPGSGTLGLSFDALWNLDVPEGQTSGRYGGGAE